MKVGMIQSNFIPWRGYFDFIDDVDLFVFYDDVQYTHKDWRNRNRIKTANGPMWLSVPVIHDHNMLIQDAQIDYQGRWIDKHIRSISIAYAKTPFFKSYAHEYFDIVNSKLRTISELNVTACRWAMAKLGIGTRTKMSSEFGIVGDKSCRPLKILKSIGASAYLSGRAAQPYTNHERFREAQIALEYKTYDYREYPQIHGQFDPHVSVLDLLFNVGQDARNFLKSESPNEKAL